MSTRCGYPRPTPIPVCAWAKTSWTMNRWVLADIDESEEDVDVSDDLLVPWTWRMLRAGLPCPSPTRSTPCGQSCAAVE